MGCTFGSGQGATGRTGWANAGWMLLQRRRRWHSILSALVQNRVLPSEQGRGGIARTSPGVSATEGWARLGPRGQTWPSAPALTLSNQRTVNRPVRVTPSLTPAQSGSSPILLVCSRQAPLAQSRGSVREAGRHRNRRWPVDPDSPRLPCSQSRWTFIVSQGAPR